MVNKKTSAFRSLSFLSTACDMCCFVYSYLDATLLCISAAVDIPMTPKRHWNIFLLCFRFSQRLVTVTRWLRQSFITITESHRGAERLKCLPLTLELKILDTDKQVSSAGTKVWLSCSESPGRPSLPSTWNTHSSAPFPWGCAGYPLSWETTDVVQVVDSLLPVIIYDHSAGKYDFMEVILCVHPTGLIVSCYGYVFVKVWPILSAATVINEHIYL